MILLVVNGNFIITQKGPLHVTMALITPPPPPFSGSESQAAVVGTGPDYIKVKMYR